MGGRTRNGNDRLRTIWTPEMDRYFIDLMLEQVDKGNRIDDHLFSKRAWKQMTTLFNSKFNFQYEKDVLKNRHKTLRNLYKAIKNLLCQKGFSWDEQRQMVTADNNVWDEYVKAHPDARSYRIKTIPYYNDLCLIYRNENTEQKDYHFVHDGDLDNNISGSKTSGMLEALKSPATSVDDGEPSDIIHELSHSGGNEIVTTTEPMSMDVTAMEALHEIMINEDYDISLSKETVDEKPQALPGGTGGSTVGHRTRTYWQPPMDRYFIDLMLDQVQKGNQVDGVFRKQAWMEMIAFFNAKFGFKYDMDVLKNRFKTLRRQYNVIRSLLDLNGFVWDDTRQMVTADDSVWQDYIKAHTNARQYMTRPVPYYQDLCVICRELGIDGRDTHTHSGYDEPDEIPEVKFQGLLKISESPAASLSSEEQQLGELKESSHSHSGLRKSKRQLENPSNTATPKISRKNDGDRDMASALREVVTAASSISEKKKDDENSGSISIESVIEAVQALPDMDEELVLDACDFLEDEKKAKTFLALDVKLRKKWLMRKLRPQQLLGRN